MILEPERPKKYPWWNISQRRNETSQLFVHEPKKKLTKLKQFNKFGVEDFRGTFARENIIYPTMGVILVAYKDLNANLFPAISMVIDLIH